MPILEDDDLDDRAVLWVAAGSDGMGQPVFDSPVEVWVNWRIKRQQVLSADGTMILLDAQATVDRSIALGSRMWVAPDHTTDALEQWYGTGSAGQTDEVMRVAIQGSVRDMKAIETRYTVGLQWDRDTGG